VHELLVHTTTDTPGPPPVSAELKIDADDTVTTTGGIQAPWSVRIIGVDLTLRISCTGAAMQTVDFKARIEVTALGGA
jgi:hypothetical protein